MIYEVDSSEQYETWCFHAAALAAAFGFRENPTRGRASPRHNRENPKPRQPENPAPSGAASAAPTYPMLRVPLQSGQPVQLQNSLPAFSPRFATRFLIGLPHFGHPGLRMLLLKTKFPLVASSGFLYDVAVHPPRHCRGGARPGSNPALAFLRNQRRIEAIRLLVSKHPPRSSRGLPASRRGDAFQRPYHSPPRGMGVVRVFGWRLAAFFGISLQLPCGGPCRRVRDLAKLRREASPRTDAATKTRHYPPSLG